ncbi:DUF6233 domain-containing protein [Streptomyces swartbergensis]|uniref:DUF6233 domain-containing protein n=1 Tax=Streptomyces swartbergensis TaxID=487165 RepID=UPI003810ED87
MSDVDDERLHLVLTAVPRRDRAGLGGRPAWTHLQRREAEREHGRRVRPARPEWIVQLGIGAVRPPVQVHAGDCYAEGSRSAIDRDDARRLLASGLPACPHCQPDTELRILD